MRAFARGALSNSALWEDAAQESLVRILRSLAGYRDGNILAWALTIVRHTCVDVARAERRHARRFEARWGAVDHTDDLDVRTTIELVVAQLPEHLRFALLLHEQGFRYADIAETLQIPIGTVRSRLHEARIQLRRPLAHLFEGEPDEAPL